ncbi:hypothetical protein BRARA_F00747, partial [Brassica rapa]
MQKENQDEEHHHDEFQQPDPTKIIWKEMQKLKLGADRSCWTIHDDVQKEFQKDHRLCLVALGLNSYHQNPSGIKVALPKIWQLEGKVDGQIKDDGTVNFYFRLEHHLLTVLDKQPYSYRGWIVALDRWSNRGQPSFLKYVPFKVRIYKLPDIYRRQRIVESIASKLGQFEEASIVEPTNNNEAKVWVKILFDVDDVITLTRSVEVIKNDPPVELDFRYLGLQKFCPLCGSLRHDYEVCEEYPKLQHRQFELMDIGTNPYKPVAERNAAIEEYIISKEIGESSATATTNLELTPTHILEAQTVGTIRQEVLPQHSAQGDELMPDRPDQ